MANVNIDQLPAITSLSFLDELLIWSKANSISNKVALKDVVFKSTTIIVAPNTSTTKADYDTTGTNDDVQVQKAINDCNSKGGGVVLLREGIYTFHAAVIPKSNVTVKGMGQATIIKSDAAINCFEGITAVLSNVVFEDLTFLGNTVSTPTSPQRARTTNGAGMDRGIYLSGSLNPNGTFPVITDVAIRNCNFHSIGSTNNTAPISIFGISGKATVTGCEFIYTLDPGFIYCNEVMFNNNYVYGSADNGVSISRGNKKAACVGNTFENCCYFGIWLAGYIGQTGPTNVTCVGNTIKDVGYSGITLHDAPENCTIVGNDIDCGFFRGPSDQHTDFQCNGIMIAGFDYTNPAAPSVFAKKIQVVGNRIKNAARAGVYINGTIVANISNNLITDCGTQFLADGVTAILSTDLTQNIGILVDVPSTVTDIRISNNHITDERGTAFCNYGVVPAIGSAEITLFGNYSNRLRNSPLALSMHTGGQRFPRKAVADADYTITTGDYIVAESALTNPRTITLPTAVGVTSQVYIIKDEAGTANSHTITIATTSAQTIDGASTKTITTSFGSVKVYSDGANWFTH